MATNLAIDGWHGRRRVPPAGPGATSDHSGRAAFSVDLGAGLRALPRRRREAVVLRHLIDLPEAAVAAAMGCSVGAVKQHTRGLAALRGHLGNGEE
ncbi:MAG: sigma factor-like helix-turn-helix DNA-binding protein [Acidimicrobiales bacterium]